VGPFAEFVHTGQDRHNFSFRLNCFGPHPRTSRVRLSSSPASSDVIPTSFGGVVDPNPPHAGVALDLAGHLNSGWGHAMRVLSGQPIPTREQPASDLVGHRLEVGFHLASCASVTS